MSDETAFECVRCGRCCSQRLILLNTDDVFRIAEHFHLSVPLFMEKYGVVFARAGGNRSPRLYLQITGDVCPFYADGCSIHPVKPLMCRMFPALKPGKTAGDLKRFISEHAHSEGVKSCKIFSLPDDVRIAVDREAMITTVIYDSVETIYYSDLRRSDMKFVRGLLKAVDRAQVRSIVRDYLFNGSRTSGLVFEQAMFEIQALCQLADWKQSPYLVALQGIKFEPGRIVAFVSPQDARDIYAMSVNGEIEAVFSQTNPSVADPACVFLSVAVRSRRGKGLMLALMGRKDELRKAAKDGEASLAFYPSDMSMDMIGTVLVHVDPEAVR